MSYNQHQAPHPVYPAPSTAYPPTYAAPLPASYPMNDGAPPFPQQAPAETKDRGDGFWRGCCAALCCCCMLDMCF